MLAASGNLQYKITSIALVTNPVLADKFNKKRAKLKGRKVNDTPILSFHGTPDVNIESIIKTNFRPSVVGTYGPGVYFSEYPLKSIAYSGGSNSMIVCQILLGEDGRDSTQHVPDSAGRCQEIVIKNVDLILPLYVIHYSQ